MQRVGTYTVYTKQYGRKVGTKVEWQVLSDEYYVNYGKVAGTKVE